RGVDVERRRLLVVEGAQAEQAAARAAERHVLADHLFERGPLLEHGHILGHEPSRHQASLGRRADGSGARPHLPSQPPPLDVAVSGTTTLVPSAVMRTPSETTSAWLTAIPAGRPSTGISIAVTRSRSTPGSDSGVICLPPRVRFCASTSSLPVSTR